jgi:hypothetical protein
MCQVRGSQCERELAREKRKRERERERELERGGAGEESERKSEITTLHLYIRRHELFTSRSANLIQGGLLHVVRDYLHRPALRIRPATTSAAPSWPNPVSANGGSKGLAGEDFQLAAGRLLDHRNLPLELCASGRGEGVAGGRLMLAQGWDGSGLGAAQPSAQWAEGGGLKAGTAAACLVW